MLNIHINNLDEGEHNYDFAVSPDELEVEDVDIVSDVNISAKLYKSGNQISFKVNVRGKFKFQCDRCLDEYLSDFSNEFVIIYKYDFDDPGSLQGDDDIKFISPNTRYIDLRNDIRDYILLSVPMRKVPEEVAGDCSHCNKKIQDMLKTEKREDINPVWEKLIKAKIK
jgi:DUF177 domain-containing protein